MAASALGLLAWHINENIFHFDLCEVIHLWEANGQIVAMLNPDTNGEAFFQIHPAFRDEISIAEMLDVAEGKLHNVKDDGKKELIVGGKVWQMCRSGEQNPDNFGIFEMHGLGFVRGNLVRDIASLNKVELLPWDCWGIILTEQLDNPDDLSMLDEVAALTAGDVPDFETVRSRYETDLCLHVNGSLLSYVNGNMVEINMA